MNATAITHSQMVNYRHVSYRYMLQLFILCTLSKGVNTTTMFILLYLHLTPVRVLYTRECVCVHTSSLVCIVCVSLSVCVSAVALTADWTLHSCDDKQRTIWTLFVYLWNTSDCFLQRHTRFRIFKYACSTEKTCL